MTFNYLLDYAAGIIHSNASSLIFEIGAVIIAATFIAYFARVFKQPLIPAYVIAGIILGPVGLGMIRDTHLIQTISEIGIIFLLFIVGIEINLKKLKTVGFAAAVGGIAQVAITFAAGTLLAKYIGFSGLHAMYIGVILAFSSTMIVIKLLSDYDEISTLHGRIIIAILLIQDVLVILIMTVLMKVSMFSAQMLGSIILKAALLVALGWLANKFIVTKIFRFAAKSDEFLFLLSLSMCFFFSLAAYILNFSLAVGAFVGGVALANLPYSINIVGRIKPLKDFFATIFFVSLGMQLAWVSMHTLLYPMIIFLTITLIFKPLIILILLGLFGYGKRTAFISAISLAQLSEFALIIVTDAKDIIGPEIFSATIISAIVTISSTAYLIKYKDSIYNRLSGALSIFEKISIIKQKTKYSEHDGKKKRVVLFGAHRMGIILLKKFKHMHKGVLVVDFDPEIISRLIDSKISCMYGDMSNEEVLRHIKFKDVKYVISTVPKVEDNLVMMKYVRSANPKTKIIVTANHIPEALDLYEAGADYVVVPNITSGESLADTLGDLLTKQSRMIDLRKEHLKHILEINSVNK